MTFLEQLATQASECALTHHHRSVVILGRTTTALALHRQLTELGLARVLRGISDPDDTGPPIGPMVEWQHVPALNADLVVIATDHDKERLLHAYAELMPGPPFPHVIIAGTGHLAFNDVRYDALDAPALVRSYANGYRWTRVHIYQCLAAAAANGLSGAIVEFGAFKGGTTAWLARVAAHFGLSGPVIGFDSWSGFPPRRSLLDLYEHPRCVFSDFAAVRAYVEPLGIELVPGDITDTAGPRLRSQPVLLAFIDTDNYSPAKTALNAVLPNLVVGGAIVFDHYTTTAEFLYTLGERMAGTEALATSGLLHLHDTGVFIKIR
jgi:O-methyltransferase